MADLICSWPRMRIPDSCRGAEVVIGIDEAGRGCVLGSLIYCAAFWPKKEHDDICKLGFNDSKQLKEDDRNGFFNMIKSHPSIGWVIEELTAEFISQEMLRANPISLNALSYSAVVRGLEKIRDIEPRAPVIGDIFIDTVGDPETYRSRLTRELGDDFGHFTIEKKADATYKVVGAASIIAKVTRDTQLKEWQWTVVPSSSSSTSDSTASRVIPISKEFGSGYPSDEVCVNWLKSVQNPIFGYPSLVRHSWATCREALKKGGACVVRWQCDEEEPAEDLRGVAPITSFFSAGSSGDNAKMKLQTRRPSFFTQRKLRRLSIEDLN